MKFSRSLAVASVTLASLTLGSPLAARDPDCPLPADLEPSCSYLVSTCAQVHVVASKSLLWYNKICVAAATCYGVGKLEDAVSCKIEAPVTNAEQWSLDYNTVYSTIVGSCAYDSGGCPITQQNYIDFYYGTISGSGGSIYPSSANTVIGWWQAIEAWAATGDTIPYLNFNDWLHYSTYNTNVPTTTSSSPSSTPVSVSISTSAAPTTTA